MKHLLALAITTLLATPSLAAPRISLNPRQPPTTLLHGVTPATLRDQDCIAQKSSQRMTYVNAYGLDSGANDTAKTDVLYAGVWEKPRATYLGDGRTGEQASWKLVQGLDQDAYVEEFYTLRDQRGFRPRVVKGYNAGEERDVYFSGVWDEAKPGLAWEHRVGMSQAGFKRVLEDLLEKGYRVSHLSGYEQDGEARYTAVWEKRGEDDPVSAWYALVNLSKEGYEAESKRFEDEGYVPAVVDGYAVGGEVKFAALWEKRDAKRVERHGLSKEEFEAEVEKLAKECYEVTVVSQYGEGDGDVRYAAIWEARS